MTFSRATDVAPESAWFKSSYSDSQGGSCVEIAALFPEHAWHKSSYSDSQGGSCVEVATLTPRVGIRDSKDKQGPALLVPTPAWRDFVAFAAGPIIPE
ncbi:DUF397 domain-containing protein [Streptomyces jumonjinensis]|uniref:DUF397 domain-containing protein n=1 Tax=Streptomyces jumonjinensis TaxID=1945 RepID=A0A646KQG1_STRJU|nr:DUF397 domain-containing protein [Streptomyces jumonjinensis]MQT04308.1 DUF397 domain-containing protein [Streptomyces jumonjinensis]